MQRCLWHLARGVYRAARYTDRASHDLADDFAAQLATLLTAAYRNGDLDAARAAYTDLIEDADACGARATAAHLRGAETEVFTFLTPPRRRPAPLRRQRPPPSSAHAPGWEQALLYFATADKPDDR